MRPPSFPISAAQLWLVTALVAGVVEVLSPTFGFVFVGVGAIVVAGLAWLGLGLVAQLGTFAVVVLACLLFLRPRLVGKLGAPGVPTRAEALRGRIGRVTVAIDPLAGAGRVEVDGQDWAARSDRPLEVGARVRVEHVDGIVLNVRSADGPEAPPGP